MSTFPWFDPMFCERLTVALLHFVWQGAAIGVLAAAGGWLLQRTSSQARYVAQVVALVAMFCCLPVTYLLVAVAEPAALVATTPAPHRGELQPLLIGADPNPSASEDAGDAAPAHDVDLQRHAGRQLPPPVDPAATIAPLEPSSVAGVAPRATEPAPSIRQRWLRGSAHYVTAVYLVGVVVLLVRLLHGAWSSRQLGRSSVDVTEADLLNRVRMKAERLGLQVLPALRWCAEVSIPVVIGVVRPIILLPASAATGLSANQLEAVIAHELAHIRRYDLFVNMLQRVIESLLYFHPAVWWVSQQITNEREQACDELVLTTGLGRAQYADALVTMAELSCGQRERAPATALAANGSSPTEFKRRVLNVLGSESAPPLRLSRVAATAVVAAALLALATQFLWNQSLAEPGDITAAEAERGKSKTEQNGAEAEGGDGRALVVDTESQLLTTLLGNGKVDSRTVSAAVTLVAAHAANDKEFAKRVLAEFEKSCEGGERKSQAKRHLLAVVTEMFDAWGARRWREQLAPLNPNDHHQVALPNPGAQLESEALALVIRHGRNADRSDIHSFTLAVRSLHHPEARMFLRDVVLNPETAADAFGQTVPGTTPGRKDPSPTFPLPDATTPVPRVSNTPGVVRSGKWKDNVGGTWTDAKFTAAVGLAELGDVAGFDWLLIRARPNEFGIDDSLWRTPHFHDRSGSLRESCRYALADLFGQQSGSTFQELDAWWKDNQADFIARRVTLNPSWYGAHAATRSAPRDEPTRQHDDPVPQGAAIPERPRQPAADEAGPSSPPEDPSLPFLDRPVSLSVENEPLRLVVAGLAAQAGLTAEFDDEALRKVELDLQERITATFQNIPLGEALTQVIPWTRHPGAMREVRGSRLVLTTLAAWQGRTRERLPDWMKPLYSQGLLATLDENDVGTVTVGDIMTDELLGKVSALPKCRELDFVLTKGLTPEGLTQLGRMSRLEKLTVSIQAEGLLLGDDVVRNIVGLGSLRELSLIECGLTDAGAKLLQQMPQLRSLSLRQEGRLTDEALKSISKLNELESLSLDSYVGTERLGRMRFSAAGIRELRGLKNLKSLRLVGHEVPADAIDFPQLTALALGHASIGDDVAKQIEQLRELRGLELTYSRFGDDALKSIAALPELRRFSFSGTTISDAGIEHLSRHPRLEHIELRASGLTDRSLEHLSQIKTLTRLDLYGSGQPGVAPGRNFTSAGLTRLKNLPNLRTLWLTNLRLDGGYEVLKELRELRELHMMMCDVKDAELDALQDALPNTNISHMTGGLGWIPK